MKYKTAILISLFLNILFIQLSLVEGEVWICYALPECKYIITEPNTVIIILALQQSRITMIITNDIKEK